MEIKEKGLEIVISEGGIYPISDVNILREEDCVDAENLLALAGEVWPGVYQTYKQKRERHKELDKELREIMGISQKNY